MRADCFSENEAEVLTSSNFSKGRILEFVRIGGAMDMAFDGAKDGITTEQVAVAQSHGKTSPYTFRPLGFNLLWLPPVRSQAVPLERLQSHGVSSAQASAGPRV